MYDDTSAMSAIQDLIQGEADIADESDDESFNEETGEAKRRSTNGANGNLDDSSEEDEDDDDEEAARAVSPTFLFFLHSPVFV